MATLAVNAPILLTIVYAGALLALDPDLYYRSVQEDESLEWATFFAFALACGLFATSAFRYRAQSGRLPWFFLGVALFCAFVAMEEISWAQRVLGYRPPAYLLEYNFQQEMNLHNVVDGGLRQAAFLGIVFGYGVALPLLVRIRSIRRRAGLLGIVPPALALAPSFATTGLVYTVYPFSHTGEWAELMLGLGMLFAATMHLCDGLGEADRRPAPGLVARVLIGFVVVLLLGIGTARAWWRVHGARPDLVALARVELAALRVDASTARTRTRCGTHKRLYTLASEANQVHLVSGAFAGLTAQGLPTERAEFLLDPWNSPYWIRHVCAPDWSRRAIYVYSFGPNRKRDSAEWEIVEDDLGAWVSRPPASDK